MDLSVWLAPWGGPRTCNSTRQCAGYIVGNERSRSTLEVQCSIQPALQDTSERVCHCSTWQFRVGEYCGSPTLWSMLSAFFCMVNIVLCCHSFYLVLKIVRKANESAKESKKLHTMSSFSLGAALLGTTSCLVWALAKLLLQTTSNAILSDLASRVESKFGIAFSAMFSLSSNLLVSFAWSSLLTRKQARRKSKSKLEFSVLLHHFHIPVFTTVLIIYPILCTSFVISQRITEATLLSLPVSLGIVVTYHLAASKLRRMVLKVNNIRSEDLTQYSSKSCTSLATSNPGTYGAGSQESTSSEGVSSRIIVSVVSVCSNQVALRNAGLIVTLLITAITTDMPLTSNTRTAFHVGPLIAPTLTFLLIHMNRVVVTYFSTIGITVRGPSKPRKGSSTRLLTNKQPKEKTKRSSTSKQGTSAILESSLRHGTQLVQDSLSDN